MTDGERETLAIALDHAWRWYENRRHRSLILLQILVLWLAILGAAYGVAFQAQQYGLAGVVGLLAAGSLVAAEQEASRLRVSAALAVDAVTELQDRLANALGVDALRLHRREHDSHAIPPQYLGRDIARWLVYISIVIALAGSAYTWLALP